MVVTYPSLEQLEASSEATQTAFVTDLTDGGWFQWTDEVLTPDGVNVITATGKTEGFWVRMKASNTDMDATLQEVTDNGNTTDNELNVQNHVYIGSMDNARRVYWRRALEGNAEASMGYPTTSSSYELRINFGGGGAYGTFFVNGTERARFAPDTGNLLIGTTTDNTFDKLQVAGILSTTNNAYAPSFSSLRNKQWNIFGDSFSNDIPNDYVGRVRDALGLIATTNAVSGQRLSQQLAIAKGFVAGAPNYFQTFDIVSLHIGVNDFANDTIPLGTPASTIGDGTFAGDLKDFIQVITTSNPNIKLYIITPPEANGAGVLYKAINSQGWGLKDLSVLISNVCLDYSVQCIDLYSMSGFNLQTISSLTADGLHPNTNGMIRIADIVARAFQANHSHGRTGNYEDIIHTTGNESKVGNLGLNGIFQMSRRTAGTAGSPSFDDLITYGTQAKIVGFNEATNNFGKGWSFYTTPTGTNVGHEAFRLGFDKTATFYGNVVHNTAPTTSAGTYDILTRNTSTGVVEKILSSAVYNSATQLGTNGGASTQLTTTTTLLNAIWQLQNQVNAITDANLSKTANYTVLTTDFGKNGHATVFVDANAGAVQIELPAANQMVGKTVNVIKTDATANAVTVKGNGSTNINGANTLVLSNIYDKSGGIKSNGTQYYIL